MSKKNIFNTIALLAVGLCSCQNDEELTTLSDRQIETAPHVNTPIRDESYYVLKMAELLNQAVGQDPTVVRYLQEEAARQIDGDFNVLLAKSIHSQVRATNPLNAALSTQLESRSTSEATTSSLIEEIKKNAPLLNVYFPEGQKLDQDEFLTVILDPSFDDSKDKTVKAFNKKGEIVEISADEEPDVPYMVIGINERITLTSETGLTRSTSGPIFTNEYHSYYLPDCFNKEKKAFIPSTYASHRGNRSNPDVISRAKFKSSNAIKRVEKWMRGAPEVHLTVIYADKSPADIVFGPLLHNLQFNLGDKNWYTGPRRKKRPRDNFGNWYITNWTNCQKTYMKYHFHEMDNKFKVTVNGWEVKFSGGDLIGDSKVNYSDNLGTTYHIGDMFEFDIK